MRRASDADTLRSGLQTQINKGASGLKCPEVPADIGLLLVFINRR
jgi:hypothetical protein